MGDAESATGMNVMFHDSIRPRPSLNVCLQMFCGLFIALKTLASYRSRTVSHQ